jgi:tetratricopeptide (TPR) repeat protein
VNTLVIRHSSDSNPPSFALEYPRTGKRAEPVEIVPPTGFPVEGRPNSDLMRELRWYLETFLDYPFPPETDHAENILNALRAWGREAFNRLFDSRDGEKFLAAATENGHYERLHLQVWSDDPRILAWPWEALEDSRAARIAQLCQIERRLNEIHDPVPLDAKLPQDRVNILLVTARPYENDVRYRSIARPLVDLIEKDKLPAKVTVLRPPTFDNLREHLRQNPHTYHILHFDGHGGYGEDGRIDASRHTLRGYTGKLVFEGADGKPDAVPAEKLSTLLREHATPAVVLNACQSGMIDRQAEDPFAGVATALLQSGMRSTVAMAYSLYVSGAQQFLPAFYRRLFETGDAAQAVRAGRQEMYAHDERVCARGRYPLQDWLVPVLYQQDPLDFSFAKRSATTVTAESRLPDEARDDKNPYGFIGRDGAILDLERALLRPPAAILIRGLGGVGKTTLARGFLRWLEQTDGLGAGALWFTFSDIHSAEFVLNRMGEAFFGSGFGSAPLEQRFEALVTRLRETRLFIVWDNFEVVKGIEGTAITANLTQEDRDLLKRLVERLRGGQTKILITSRADEAWLGGPTYYYTLPLGGLDGDERWEYCEAVVQDLGLSVKRDDPEWKKLMDLLGGHTLSMRAILPLLQTRSAAQIAGALRSNLSALNLPEDEVSSKLAATLRFVEETLPPDLRPLLLPLALHENYVQAGYLEYMTKRVESGPSRNDIDRFLQTLETAGLLQGRGTGLFELHPALTGYLRAAVLPGAESGDAWARAFVEVMASLADQLAPRPLHEQRIQFFLFGGNFHMALSEAERLKMDRHATALSQSLGIGAENRHDFSEAVRLFRRFAEHSASLGDAAGEATAYNRLGIIAQYQRDFPQAEQWYLRSLAISEKQGNQEGVASAYHQLGMVAEHQRDFPQAEQWYLRSLTISEKQGFEHGAAFTYHQLGVIAHEQGELAQAEQWCLKSLAIEQKLGNEGGVAQSYNQLGMIAQKQGDFPQAEQWYLKSFAISEKRGNQEAIGMSYHQLGIIAHAQRDFAQAEQLYRNSLTIREKLGNEYDAAMTYGQLGLISEEQRQFEQAASWLLRSMSIFIRLEDAHFTSLTMQHYTRLTKQAPGAVKEKLRSLWREAGLGELPQIDTDAPEPHP